MIFATDSNVTSAVRPKDLQSQEQIKFQLCISRDTDKFTILSAELTYHADQQANINYIKNCVRSIQASKES